jgi:alpha-L-fucosidase
MKLFLRNVSHPGLLALGIAAAANSGLGAQPGVTNAPAGSSLANRSVWEGYERLDFVVAGRPCLLVLPRKPGSGKPWIWRTEFFGHEPQADLALLTNGFHVAYMDVQNLYGAPVALNLMDQFHAHLTREFGLSPKAVLEGFSRGGLFAFNWAARHPERVSCLYVDAPVCDFKSWPAGWGKGRGSPEDWERCKQVHGLTDEQARAYRLNPVDHLAPLAAAHVPILSVCGDADDVVPMSENTGLVHECYAQLGGPITVITKPAVGHHPHSLKDPRRIVEFILRATSGAPLAPGELSATVILPNCVESQQARIKWWREARFGLFIHWGPSSVSGKEISWARIGHPFDHRGHESVPAAVYDNLYRQFNPVKFDADAWMRLAKAAGMKYVVFITKHHDGFSMWSTKLRAEYSIATTPFGQDLCKEIADAAHRHGLKLGWYYSTRDWTHPDYLKDGNAKYNDFYHGQVRELLFNYGKVDLLWFDHVAGNWRDYRFQELFDMIYRLQPAILVNNRAAAFIRPTEDRPAPELAALVRGDFDTPEQHIGAFQNQRPWESCVTMTQCADGGGWSYRPDGGTRSFDECWRMLVDCAAGDGNLLLNVGPLPTGEIAADQQAVLRQMGQRLAKHGESIYGTRGGPFRNGEWGGATHRDKTIYLHVFCWSGDAVQLPTLKAKVLRATALTGGTPVVEQHAGGVRISLPPDRRDQTDTIIRLDLDSPAEGEFVKGKPLQVSLLDSSDTHAPSDPAQSRNR